MSSRARMLVLTVSLVVACGAINGCDTERISGPVASSASNRPRLVRVTSDGGDEALARSIAELEAAAQDPVRRRQFAFGTTAGGTATLEEVLAMLKRQHTSIPLVPRHDMSDVEPLSTNGRCSIMGASWINSYGSLSDPFRTVAFDAYTTIGGCDLNHGDYAGGRMTTQMTTKQGWITYGNTSSFSGRGGEKTASGKQQVTISGDRQNASIRTTHTFDDDFWPDPPDAYSSATKSDA